ncbi:MAG TPA: potassium transporter Kup [Thermoanaerobaculia bacterium]|jgi:KUP system potassium uptake protein|nr:potassium transporter Kup [Thermoanaerobaculia bacterium]
MTQRSSQDSGLSHLLGLSLGALGVVYGDIGTSPLYALRECFLGSHSVPPTRLNVLGVMSLIFWSLIIVISIKYLVFVMRADNRGEGGILALMALIRTGHGRRRGLLIVMGLFGAALLYGDGMITPAISVLSAVEGLEVATTFFDPYVIPITIVILVGLFVIQSRGTEGIGKLFGPVMMVWFATLALLGLRWIVREPSVLAAVNPLYAVRFFVHSRVQGFLVLGSVFLVVTGGEALYADMGHFGRRPIRIAWFTLVLPALMINYFGQGALLLEKPNEVQHPFYNMAPSWALYPLVVLATMATVIASQAVISGAFSLTRQAVQLGYSPRFEIIHTSEEEIGQIYIPSVNRVLMLATIGLVIGFRESTNLAAAYGIAVTTTMVITTILAFVVEREIWGWNALAAGSLSASFLVLDLAYFGANVIKIPHGGWFPLVVAGLIYLLMATWKRGRYILAERLREEALPIEVFVQNIRPDSPPRVPGTAVFLTTNPAGTPTTLLHNLKHNKVLHETVVLMTVVTEEVPWVSAEDRAEVEDLGKGIYRLKARYGFTQDPRAQDVLDCAHEDGLHLDLMKTTFFLGRETLIPSTRTGMFLWQKRLFGVMSRNSQRFTDFFRIPPNRVVELGMQVSL